MKNLTVYFDGCCAPINPSGWCGAGFLVILKGRLLAQGSVCIGNGNTKSNNVAEVMAAIQALQTLVEMDVTNDSILLRGDSLLAIRVLKGEIKKPSGLYSPYVAYAQSLVKEFKDLTIEWIPRERNTEADLLSKQAVEPYLHLPTPKPALKPLDVKAYLSKIKEPGKLARFIGKCRYRGMSIDEVKTLLQPHYRNAEQITKTFYSKPFSPYAQ